MKNIRLFAGTMFLIIFYVFIIMYTLFNVVHIEKQDNFFMAILFEIIGIVLLLYVINLLILNKTLKTGFFSYALMITVGYTVVLDAINIWGIKLMSDVFFTLIHLILLFIYCILLIPVCIAGKRQRREEYGK